MSEHSGSLVPHARAVLRAIAAITGWAMIVGRCYPPLTVSPDVTGAIILAALLAPVFAGILMPRRVGVAQLFLMVAVIASAVAIALRKADPTIDRNPALGAVWLTTTFAALVSTGVSVRALMPQASLARQRLAALPLAVGWLGLISWLGAAAVGASTALDAPNFTFLALMAPLGAGMVAEQRA